jgi:hypothetical protein
LAAQSFIEKKNTALTKPLRGNLEREALKIKLKKKKIENISFVKDCCVRGKLLL